MWARNSKSLHAGIGGQKIGGQKKHVKLTYFTMLALCYVFEVLQAHRFLNLICTVQSEGSWPARQAFWVSV